MHTVDLRTSLLNVVFLFLSSFCFCLFRLHTRIYWNNFCVIYSSWLDITVCALSLALILFVIKVKIFFFCFHLFWHILYSFFFFVARYSISHIITLHAHIDDMQFVNCRCACVQVWLFFIYVSCSLFFHCVSFWCLSFISLYTPRFFAVCTRARCLGGIYIH